MKISIMPLLTSRSGENTLDHYTALLIVAVMKAKAKQCRVITATSASDNADQFCHRRLEGSYALYALHCSETLPTPLLFCVWGVVISLASLGKCNYSSCVFRWCMETRSLLL